MGCWALLALWLSYAVPARADAFNDWFDLCCAAPHHGLIAPNHEPPGRSAFLTLVSDEDDDGVPTRFLILVAQLQHDLN